MNATQGLVHATHHAPRPSGKQRQAKEAERLQIERDELVKDKKLFVERVSQLEKEIEERANESSQQQTRITTLLAEQVCAVAAHIVLWMSVFLL